MTLARRRSAACKGMLGAIVLLAPVMSRAQSFPAEGLAARYAGGTGFFFNASGVVTQWLDQSAGGRALDRFGGTPRTHRVLRSGAESEVLRLDGTGRLWRGAGSFGFFTNGLVVAAHLRLRSTQNGFLFDGSSNNGMVRSRIRNGFWEIGGQPAPIGNATNADRATSSAVTGVWQTHAFRYQPTTTGLVSEHYVDGVLQATVSQPANVGLSGFILGANVSQAFPLRADVAEVLVYSQRLDHARLADLQAYLSNAWTNTISAPMRVTGASCLQETNTVPPFGWHAALQLDIHATGDEAPVELTRIDAAVTGTAPVDAVQLFGTSTSGRFAEAIPMGVATSTSAGSVSLSASVPLQSGSNRFWVAVRPARDAARGGTIDLALTAVHLSDGGPISPANADPAGELVIGEGIARRVVRRRGDDGVDTYRIPGLAVTTSGTLIATYDVRRDGSSDLPGDIDIAVMRSRDLGDTWEPQQIVLDFDASVPGSSGNGVGDPCILVDRWTGRIWIAGFWSFGNRGYNGSAAGLSTNETGQYVLTYSDDDGLTWAPPTNITAQAKADAAWGACLQGPGAGIQLRDGTLIFPSQYTMPGGASPRAFLVYSTNHGASWAASPPVNATTPPVLNENQVAEREDGSILLSSRVPSGGNGKRAWSVYQFTNALDRGGWSPVVFTNRDPICQASLSRYTARSRGHAFNWIIFANPDGTTRTNMTARLSEDEGLSWTASRVIEQGPSGYSCLAVLPDGTIGLLFETGISSSIDTIAFARFGIQWLIGDQDTDGDAMPDSYELRTGLNPAVPDGEADADGDGQSNRDEYRAGTRADESASQFRLQPAGDTVSSPPFFRSSVVPWRTYSVQRGDLNGAWVELPGYERMFATDSEIAFDLPADEGAFIRIRIP